MSIRLISFINTSIPHPLFSEIYRCIFNDTKFVLTNRNGDSSPENTYGINNFLDTLQKTAVLFEWKSETEKMYDEIIQQDQSAIQNSLSIKTLLNNEKLFYSLAHEGKEPFEHLLDAVKQDYKQLVIEKLIKKEKIAKEIVDRKTIFLLPHLKDLGPSFLEMIADETRRELSSKKINLPFAFMKHLGDGREMESIDRLIELIHSNIIAEDLKEDHFKVEGPLLICGETGTGKSYAVKSMARRLKNNRFVEINLSAVSETLFESRLRGYKKGAFTGAAHDTAGWFEEAQDGILFLDEFQSMEPHLQTQFLDLLNAVSDKVSIARMGEDDDRKSYKVKTVLAINEDLQKLITENRLRKDLLYRIRKIANIGNLKQRLTSSEPILETLLKTYCWKSAKSLSEVIDSEEFNSIKIEDMLFPKINLDAFDALKADHWPGNFRELERVAYELYHERNLMPQGSSIEIEEVKSAINEFRFDTKTESMGVEELHLLSSNPETIYLQMVEKILAENKFNITNSLPTLKKIRIGSYQTLQGYLKKNIAHLNDETKKNLRIE